jgi:hypothetical protein
MIRDEFNYYKENQNTIVAGHIGEYVVIKNNAVIGYYKTEDEAFSSMKHEKLETFLVHKCKEKGKDLITYHTLRVKFA